MNKTNGTSILNRKAFIIYSYPTQTKNALATIVSKNTKCCLLRNSKCLKARYKFIDPIKIKPALNIALKPIHRFQRVPDLSICILDVLSIRIKSAFSGCRSVE
jgi:hypothetical protein